MADIIFFALILGAVFWGWLNFKNSASSNFSDRLTRTILPLALVILGGLIIRLALVAPFWDRNASRLVGLFSLKYGYRLYYGWGEGPLQSMNYPPLAALSFFPLLIFNSPTPALIWGDILNAFFFFAPALLVLQLESKKGGFLRLAAPLFVIFAFMAYESPSLKYSAFRIHADAPALGFSAMACYFLLKFIPSPKNRFLIYSAVSCAAALWTKQNTAPLLISLPLVVFLWRGKKALGKFLAFLAMGLAFFAIILLPFYSLNDLLLNTLFLGKKPWTGPFLDVMVLEFVRLMQESLWPVMVMIIFGTLNFLKTQEEIAEFPWLLKKNPWLIFPVIGISMIPVSLITRGKFGGDVNSFSPVIYFFNLGAVTAVVHFLQKSWTGPRFHRIVGQIFVTGFLCLFIMTHGIPLSYFRFSSYLDWVNQNPQETAFRYAKAHPGETYFPWNPLSNLMAEKKLYHFEPAILDWTLAGYNISNEHYKKFTPDNPKIIAFHKANEFGHKVTQSFFPSYTETDSPDLPDWIVLAPPRR